MWEWSKTVAEYAAAASWTSWQQTETEPTIVDPDFTTTATEGDSDGADRMAVYLAIMGYDLVG
ncbi:hypothetical protein [Nocardia iowensis]|uniref:Uncharacterized protein n=1 Tax=Nocardia iowensis TaxID=204891 RepID=A0ABX8RU20_NOCIO|nr:hypothetical protein [Nocardia iowensis]QXN92751.1 hypothetical protein KV110_06380 [Nocardia iowensis]